ncbi:MAG TPA: ATP-grasp domain-containing protein [Acidimicrobiales bacterium]|nr:ATP-grasp domain-containing protein [Acidimicrobiales bacterium]
MNVLMLSPGYPAEMPFFTRALAAVGARVIGVGDQHRSNIPNDAKAALSDYVEVNFSNADDVVARVREALRGQQIDRVESLWEPLMLLAARLRESFEVPGMTVEQTVPFRDKEAMKQVLDRHGIRTPRHARATTANAVREAAERIGYPVIVKPIAGAGSADTYRVESRDDLEKTLPAIRHIPEISVEEFIDGEEFTFDTVCANNRILYHNICWYRPRPLIARQLEWISPQAIALKDLEVPYLRSGVQMGFDVIEAMGFEAGFTHMEWYLKDDGEAVFGEIGARPPGARTVDLMNYATDMNFFVGWAEAVCLGRLSQPVTRPYNAVSIFKRAQGQGVIQRIEGLGPLLADFGEHIAALDLLQPGQPRRDWEQVLISDGMVVIRHPDLAATMEMADRVGVELQLYAG